MEPVPFGKYLLCERLGEGGMAVVFRAKLLGPRGFEKVLVIKQVRAELTATREFIDMFIAEAKLTVALTHANIVPVYELGMVDGVYFLALELVDGPTLRDLIDAGPFDPALAAYVIEQVLRGLDYAHRRGVVHRDLSAANVLLSRDGEVKIVDFGIAAPAGAGAVAGGSKGYVAPEQERGGKADARADLFAAGVLLREMLSGERAGGQPARGPKPQPPAELIELVTRATEADPDRRPADAAAMLSVITRYLRACDGATQSELSQFVRRRAPDEVRQEPRADRTPTVAGGPVTAQAPGRERADSLSRTPALGTRRQVTFATRLDLEPAPPVRRRGRGLVAAGAGLVAGLALFLVQPNGPATALRPGATTRLSLRAEPPEAELRLDGRPVVAGVISVPAGRHTVAARAPKRQNAERTIELTAGVPAEVTMALLPETGRLTVHGDPTGATVYVGDQSVGMTPVDVQVPLTGPVLLHLRKRDFATSERRIEVSRFSGSPIPSATVEEKLTPLPRGQLTLGATPWAHVTVDGERKPDTPLVRLSLAVGPHAIRLMSPPTGKELRFTVQVESGKEVRRVADLRGEPRLVE